MKITVGLKLFSVALVLMVLVGAVAWINARSARQVDALITSVNETYVPAYGALARSNLRAVEEGLFVRRLIIGRLLSAENDKELSDLEHGADESTGRARYISEASETPNAGLSWRRRVIASCGYFCRPTTTPKRVGPFS
jgi:hypothetical protein